MWATFLNTRVGRALSALAVAITIVVAAYLQGRRAGGMDAIDDARDKDRERSQDIRTLGGDARARADADRRDVDDRLRDHGRFRD